MTNDIRNSLNSRARDLRHAVELTVSTASTGRSVQWQAEMYVTENTQMLVDELVDYIESNYEKGHHA